MSHLYKRRTKYATIANAALEDHNLSLKAKGLLALLLSRPDGWVYRFDWLVKQSKEGRDAVLAGIKELETFGYLKRVQRQGEGGRFIVPDYFVTDDPKDQPLTGFPVTDEPSTGEPLTENPVHLTKLNLTNTDLSKTEESSAEVEIGHFPPVTITPPPKEESQTTLSAKRIQELAKEVQRPEPSARSRLMNVVTKKDKVQNLLTVDTRIRFLEFKTVCRLPDSVWNNWVVEIVAPEAERLGAAFEAAVQGGIRAFYEATDIPKYGRTNFMTFLRGYSASKPGSSNNPQSNWTAADYLAAFEREQAELEKQGAKNAN